MNLKDDTVWLNRNQIAELFDRDVKTIGKHIDNALKGELGEDSVVAKFATVQKEGEREVVRNVKHYNLDVIISEYTKALDMLDRYDHQELLKPKGNSANNVENICYQDCLSIVDKMCFKETSTIFGVEREKGLESIIYNIYQQIGENDVYESIEEKACNFLYLIVKNHVFIDGNKRICATLFIFF